MKRLLFYVIIMITSETYQLIGQKFAPVGTKWTYGINTGDFIPPFQYEPYYLEVKEEIEFKNKLCKSIIRTSYKGEREEADLLYQDGEEVFFLQ